MIISYLEKSAFDKFFVRGAGFSLIEPRECLAWGASYFAVSEGQT